ncbi:MAG TPA: GNAT family N-acetyltransferase [Polyangiaceae bacterium]|nr:GNAT family N-acetyltransferase [Polyangiaceae bacterium]
MRPRAMSSSFPAPPSFKSRYPKKLVSAAQAIRNLASGQRVLLGSGAAEPVTLVNALVEHGQHLADTEVVHILTLGPAPYVAPEHQGRFRHTAFFIGPNTREAIQQGRADFMPVFLSEIPNLIRSRRIRIDAVLIQVAPPDRHGYASLGVSVDVVRSAVDAAELVIAEVNPNMPRTLGDSFVHVNRIDYLIEVDTPLLELLPEPLDDVAEEIGKNVATLIPDGATLQTGIGRIPHAVLNALQGHHDLGLHTEMLSDTVIELVEAGVINGRRKNLCPGKLVTSFVMGTQRLYEWVDDNPLIEMRPTEFVNDPTTIARNDNMISINSALAVDLTGQVAADTLHGRFFSGIGGQVDFIRGAARSRGGKPIIALPACAENGTISRIQAALEPGAGVVTSRGDVHYVVTEYGVADLWGKTVRERAMSLIAIAHPDFRPDLLNQAKQRHYVFPDQCVPHGPYPGGTTRVVTLRDRRDVVIRPIRITDERALQELFYRLSSESVYQRFLHFKNKHPHQEMLALVDHDYDSAVALVAAPVDDDTGRLVAMARYDVDPATHFADVAFVVDDQWQRVGLGTLLFSRLGEVAKAKGLRGFTADVLSSNKAMLGVFQASGMRCETERDGNVTHLTMRFSQSAV